MIYYRTADPIWTDGLDVIWKPHLKLQRVQSNQNVHIVWLEIQINEINMFTKSWRRMTKNEMKLFLVTAYSVNEMTLSLYYDIIENIYIFFEFLVFVKFIKLLSIIKNQLGFIHHVCYSFYIYYMHIKY